MGLKFSNKNILIIGGTGMLGHIVAKWLARSFTVHTVIRGGNTYGIEKYSIVHKDTDLRDEAAIDQLVKLVKPARIINCVGVIKQVIDESETENIFYINGKLPHILAKLAKQNNTKLIHFSTDCVFVGDKGKPYKESDKPDIGQNDVYGQSKLQGEVDDGSSLTIRTSIIGPELKGKKSLFEWFVSNKQGKVEGYSNVLYSGVTTLEMAKIVDMIIKEKPELAGLYQVAGEEISKFELLKIINEIYNLNINIEKNPEPKCDRRLDSSLFEKQTGYKSKNWKEMILEMRNFYA